MQKATATSVVRRDVFKGLLAFAAATPIVGRVWAATPGSFVTADAAKFLEAFADTLIPETDTPGAKAAGVHLGLISLIGRWASAATRTQILGTIGALRVALDERAGARFAAASAAVRLKALAALDVEAFATPMSDHWQDYRTLKKLAIRLYYSSQIGATQELRYDPLPGGYVDDLPFAPGDRNWA